MQIVRETGRIRRHRRQPHGAPIVGRAAARLPLLVMLTITILVMCFAPATDQASAQEVPELRITSTRYIVIDAATGEVFAQRRADEPVAMASLTKIFTAVEAIEEAPPDATITTTDDDLVGGDATQMGFGPGETFTLQDLLYGMMLPSGNDAARAIARALGGQPGDSAEQAVARFVARVNERVRDMGLTNTTLVNPDGWGVPGHHSSAHDLAVFTMYALRYPRFVEAIGTERYETSGGDYAFRNTNKLLGDFNGLVGGKTGFDEDAGYCLVEVASRNGSTMISVTLDGVAPDDWYDDNRVLLEYAFEQKEGRAVAGLGITGQVVGYRDPDAATIARVATSGASIGLGAPEPEATISGGIGQVGQPATGGSGEPLSLPSLDAAAERRFGGASIVALALVGGLVLLRTAVTFSRAPTRASTTSASARAAGVSHATHWRDTMRASRAFGRRPSVARPATGAAAMVRGHESIRTTPPSPSRNSTAIAPKSPTPPVETSTSSATAGNHDSAD